MRNQAPGVFDQIGEDRKGLRRQQDALLRPAIAATPETLVLDVEPECTKHLDRRSGGQMSISRQHSGHFADDEVICLIDRGNRVGGEGGPSRVSPETLFGPRSSCSF